MTPERLRKALEYVHKTHSYNEEPVLSIEFIYAITVLNAPRAPSRPGTQGLVCWIHTKTSVQKILILSSKPSAFSVHMFKKNPNKNYISVIGYPAVADTTLTFTILPSISENYGNGSLPDTIFTDEEYEELWV